MYQSYVLTVVPGSLCDLKLVHSGLLLLTCRPFLRERVCPGGSLSGGGDDDGSTRGIDGGGGGGGAAAAAAASTGDYEDSDNEELDMVAVFQERDALHFLFDIVSRKLIKLELNKLLPAKLKLS